MEQISFSLIRYALFVILSCTLVFVRVFGRLRRKNKRQIRTLTDFSVLTLGGRSVRDITEGSR